MNPLTGKKRIRKKIKIKKADSDEENIKLFARNMKAFHNELRGRDVALVDRIVDKAGKMVKNRNNHLPFAKGNYEAADYLFEEDIAIAGVKPSDKLLNARKANEFTAAD